MGETEEEQIDHDLIYAVSFVEVSSAKLNDSKA